MVKKWIGRLYALGVFVFLYAPIAVLIAYSFNSGKSRGRFEGFTLDWYRTLFHNQQIISALYYTLVIAVLSATIATVIGVAAAIGLSQMKPRFQKAAMNVNYLPVLNPDIVTGIALMLFFVSAGVRLGFGTMLLAHIVFNIPYVILSVAPRLRKSSARLMEAAMDLGATPMQALWRVVLPGIFPGIMSGFLIAFTLSIDDFVISFFTTGSGVSNLSIEIYSMARRGIKPEINALSTLLFVSVLLLLIGINLLSKWGGRKKNGDELAEQSLMV